MTEDQLQALVTAACSRRGLLWHHCADSRRCAGRKGLLDLIIAGPNGVLFAELKGEDGETSAEQDLWLWMLHRGDQRCVVWGPADWESGSIRRMLEALAGS